VLVPLVVEAEPPPEGVGNGCGERTQRRHPWAPLGKPPEGRGQVSVRSKRAAEPEPEPEPAELESTSAGEGKTPALSHQLYRFRLAPGGADSEAELGEARKAEKEAGARVAQAQAKAEAARKAENEQHKRQQERKAVRKAHVDGATLEQAPVLPLRYRRTRDSLNPDTTEGVDMFCAPGANALGEADAAGKMGAFCAKHGRYSEALVYYQKAAAVYSAELGPQHPTLGSTWNRMGEVYEKQEQFVESMRHYQMAAATALSPMASPTSSD